MLFPAADQVAVDLIRNDPEVIFLNDLSDAGQLLLRPHPAGRILRIAPEDQLALGIGALGLKVLIIQHKGAVRPLFQRRINGLDMGVFGRMEKISIRRCVDEHLLVRCTKGLRKLVQRRDDTGREAQLLLGKFPVIMILAPLGKRIVIIMVVHAGIAENTAVDPLAHLVQDLGRNAKIHICHPHADKLIILIGEHFFGTGMENVPAEAVCTQSIGMLPVNDLIKIIHRKHAFFLIFCNKHKACRQKGQSAPLLLRRTFPADCFLTVELRPYFFFKIR